MTQKKRPPKSLVALFGLTAAAGMFSLVTGWEGVRYNPYRDLAGISTICYGDTHNVSGPETEAQCLDRLEKQLTSFASEVKRCTPDIYGNQLAAATSLAYNIGSTRYCASTVAKKFNRYDYLGACNGFLAWNKVNGKVVKGLQNRRQAERMVCLKGL